ncbi:energy-coupling factor ABC transporter ATP-binding protein [Enterovirga sp. CN4-39]|uniref:energy-coupling factor ABC transporter ATP-binding protein n=1 Tax=Enterovirga sp. CN4-39 TaxID=3400910 RepID=UPI003C0C06DB
MSHLLSLEGVCVSRGQKSVLRDVDLTLAPGERLAIVGPNGSGKTTLLRTIVGLERPQEGSIRLFGTECIDERHFRQFRPRIAYLFQDSDDHLFCPSVVEDVSFGPLNAGCTEREAEERARNALDELGVGHLAERISHRLSGGEKRLVCLAGLLAMRPDVLMLDEPTNGIDEQNGELLRRALHPLPCAMLLVSHDAVFVGEFATRAVALRNGKLLPAEIHEHVHVHHHRHIHVRSD